MERTLIKFVCICREISRKSKCKRDSERTFLCSLVSFFDMLSYYKATKDINQYNILLIKSKLYYRITKFHVTVQTFMHYIHKTCQQLLYIKNNIVIDCCQPLRCSFCFIHYVNERLFYHINSR